MISWSSSRSHAIAVQRAQFLVFWAVQVAGDALTQDVLYALLQDGGDLVLDVVDVSS